MTTWACMHVGVYPQDKAYPRDKKLKWHSCQQDITILYHYLAENLYLLFGGDRSLSAV